MKISIIFHSIQGHTYEMAKAVAKGASEVEGAEVGLYRVPETLPSEVIEKMGGGPYKERIAKVPEATMETLSESDAVIFGVGARFGNMSAQMRAFLDMSGKVWMERALVGKPGGVFVTTANQHGGQESTILAFHISLLHHGMIIVGVPYSEQRQTEMGEITGGSPYGASTISSPDASRYPSKNELGIAKFQGRHTAEIASKLACEKPVKVSH